MSLATRNREFTEYMTGVMEECLGNIPLTQRGIDPAKSYAMPRLFFLKTAHEATLSLACQARRSGAESRAQALEWAFDSLIRGTGMKRVGEVFSSMVTTYEGEEVKYFYATVRERDENE